MGIVGKDCEINREPCVRDRGRAQERDSKRERVKEGVLERRRQCKRERVMERERGKGA